MDVDVLLSPVTATLPALISHGADPDSPEAAAFRLSAMAPTPLSRA